MPTSTSKAVRVAVLADSDTRWKWGALTARRIAPHEAANDAPDPSIELSGFLLRGRATPTARQLAEVGVSADDVREVTGGEFLRAMKDERYDVVVLALVGGAVQAVLHGLAALDLPRRPVVVTGYVGVVYEKLADGLLLRHGADVVLANSRHDADRFRAVYEGVGADASSVTEAALPFLGGAPYRAQDDRGTVVSDAVVSDAEVRDTGVRDAEVCGTGIRTEVRDTVVFAAQPSVPESRADRTYLLRRLVEHARLHPNRDVLLKLRSKPGEHTTHLEELPYQKLADKLPGGLPPNFSLVYGHMGEVLDRTDLLVTVSSTAALESLHRRIPTAVLTDLGVREALGNHHFLGSGLLTSWDRLDGGHRPDPDPDPEWLARQGVAADGSYDTAFDVARRRVAELLERPELPPLAPYYTPTTAPGYLPALLARHHLASDGTPLQGAAPKAEITGIRRVVRDAVREAARGAYRHGVQRVAPVIRRMGEL